MGLGRGRQVVPRWKGCCYDSNDGKEDTGYEFQKSSLLPGVKRPREEGKVNMENHWTGQVFPEFVPKSCFGIDDDWMQKLRKEGDWRQRQRHRRRNV